jgi:general secretion pathway protein B
LIADRIRNSSQPNQRPLVSEAVLSHKQTQKKVPALPKPKPESIEQVRIALEGPIDELTDAAPKLPATIAKQSASAEKPKQAAALPMVKGDQSASITSTVSETTDAALEDHQQIPLIWEMDQVLREALEQLKTTIHVYSETPSQRFVIINMRRYSEGDSLGVMGYRLHAIDRDGIVVDYGNGLVRLLREKY